jgi:glycosyltransferase involved in cell wall biosynthesis
MNICMIVCNNISTDNRVLREAETLQAAGHAVSVVGTAKRDTDPFLETLPCGTKLYRVRWEPPAHRRVLLRALLWTPFLLCIIAAATWVAYVLATRLASSSTLLPSLSFILIIFAGAVLFWLSRQTDARRLRNFLASKEVRTGKRFPEPRTWIPHWLPASWINATAMPLAFLGRRFAQFAMSQERSREMAATAIGLSPDIVHAHDCAALPCAALIKKALGVPVVYDAHEIYEETSTKRFGVVDYYAFLHRTYLPIVNRFITVNESIAAYYREIYPNLAPAVVIRNAVRRPSGHGYDGRLHDAAHLPGSEKILLYQGGFTKQRGLQLLVRAAPLLPAGWSLILMGWGPLRKELRQLAEVGGGARSSDPGAQRKAIFLPGAPSADLLKWTEGASLGIIPYEGDVLNHWFCSPNKLWEYPGAGVPLLVQPFPELSAVIEQYGCGWLLPSPLTPRSLADFVASIDDESLHKAREGCRRFIDEDCWEVAYAERLRRLYESIGLMAGKPTTSQQPKSAVRRESFSRLESNGFP